FARSNRSRSNQTPLQLLAKNAPQLHPSILLLPPILPDAFQGQYLSGPPAGQTTAAAVPPQVVKIPARSEPNLLGNSRLVAGLLLPRSIS
ncbi:MAG: hypothetical protein LBC18_12345, partial [Opitutaceae bacterium]|nr:hypothetical protein [Opitutaceae bacterium]